MIERRDVIKSKESIKQAFLDLRKDKDLHKITVTQIIDHANISKGTFYAHYADIYDLQEQIEYEIIEKIFSGIENESIEVIINAPYQWVLQIVTAFYDNSVAINCLVGESNDYNFFFKCEYELLRLLHQSNDYFDDKIKRQIIDNCVAGMIIKNCYNIVKNKSKNIELNKFAAIISEFIFKMLH
ncbi:MAG: TetR/AcrR family transcriptional regulator [Eubacterium sp.]|nr:TetR/AcrR family transcriptional regulator [Eubacterium sp.]